MGIGATLSVYFDNALTVQIGTGLADQVLTPTFDTRAGGDGAEIMTIQWARCIQIF